MGFSFETLQKVLTFAHTIAEIAQLVEHQLPKLRAAGSNPVFRSKANRRMMQIIRFFVPGQDRCKLVCIRDWMGNKKGCAQHNGLLSGAPAASARECRRPNPVRASIPEAKPRLTPGIQEVPCPTASSCNSPWARTPARRPSSKGYCPQRNKFVAPWAHTPPTTISSKGYRPR